MSERSVTGRWGPAVQTIVVLEDEQHVRDSIVRALKHADFEVAEVSDGLELLRKVFSIRPDAVIMNLQVARFDGLETIRVLRAATSIPLIVLGRSHSSQMAVRSLDMGADDYIEQPADPEEVAARVRATVRRYERQSEALEDDKVIRTGSLVLDRVSQTVTKNAALVPLTRTEYRLLDALAMRVGQVAPHRYLLSTVWGEEYIDDTHYLRVYVGYLRAKLEDDPAQPRYLINEWGTGYRLATLPVREAAPPVAESNEIPEQLVAVAG
jgi:two-component system, OmpR family, KDP operon response regulator KdpE